MLSAIAFTLCSQLIHETQWGPLSPILQGSIGTCAEGTCVVYWIEEDVCTETQPFKPDPYQWQLKSIETAEEYDERACQEGRPRFGPQAPCK
jgi:hypothetical protein